MVTQKDMGPAVLKRQEREEEEHHGRLGRWSGRSCFRLSVDLGGDDDFLWALVAASDSRLQHRIDKQYAAYKAHKRQEDRYFDLGARCLDLKQMRQINKEEKTKWRQLEWQGLCSRDRRQQRRLQEALPR